MYNKKSKKVLWLVCFIVLLVSSVSVVAFASTSNKLDIQTAEVDLKESVSSKDIHNITKNYNDLIDGFVNESTVDDRTYTGFFRVPKGKFLDESIKDYEAGYYNGLVDAKNSIENRIPNLKDEKTKKSAELVLSDYNKRIAAYENGDTLKIKKIILKGNKDRINKFHDTNIGSIKKLEYVNEKR